MRLILLCLLIVLPIISYSQSNAASFKSTLDKHLNAVTGKNLADIEATVADSITLIFPNGQVLKSKNKFVEFHRSWFKESWKMNPQIVSTQESSSLAHALVKYHYTESDKDGKILSESNTFLLLIFQKQKGEWKLLHDQNTKII